jgi:phenylpropionate dioxygenase-like ring-hydroxylating dioxygenase large terminal subunit
MLSKEQNDLVTQTGPGTAMGDLFRCYWLPILLAQELPEADCAPVRVKVLSERLIAFRDSEGKLGLIDEFCPHRGASLWFARNEECGLRCPYHGWKFDVNGQCVDVPSEPAESGYANKIKVTSYPVIEKGGVIWTYMGKPENKPEEPNYEFAVVPTEQSFMSKRYQDCNWLQALEGGIDSSHVSFLHRGDVKSDPLFKDAGGNKYNLNDLSPVFEVIENDGGLFIGARRMAEDNQYYWRITPWLMPCYTAVPPRGDYPMHGHFWVPIDDHTCWAWSFDYHPVRALTEVEVGHMRAGKGVHVKYIPGTYMPLANKDNDYLMDRAAQKAGTTYSGIEGIGTQDASLQESMGPIVDRTKENLVGCDNGIIMARHKLMRAAKALRDKGQLPPARTPEQQAVRATALLLKREVHFRDGAKEALKAKKGVPQTSV